MLETNKPYYISAHLHVIVILQKKCRLNIGAELLVVTHKYKFFEIKHENIL